jgi:hypothetical protein
MLSRELERGTVGSAKHHRHRVLTTRHVQHLRSGIENLVERENAEVPRHELDHRSQPNHGGADTDAGEPQLGDRRVHDAHLPEFLQEPLGHFVGALIDRDFFAHQKNAIVALHLFTQRLAEGLTIRDYWHLSPQRQLPPSHHSSYQRARPRTTPPAGARDSFQRNRSRPALRL